jgi:hypothetical protein
MTADQPRVDLSQALIAEAEPIQHARPEILQQDITSFDQLSKNAFALPALQIQRYTAFVTIISTEMGAIETTAKTAERIATLRILDLDDVRTHIGQQHASQWRRYHCRDFQNLYSSKRGRHFLIESYISS